MDAVEKCRGLLEAVPGLLDVRRFIGSRLAADKSTMPVQKAPAPILPGIRSEPSKRKVVALTRISPSRFRISSA
jgi:hypothetical protein